MTTIEQLITDNLEIWSSAMKAKSAVGRGTIKKIDLHGIKKLRELILELAMRGLLVPQDPNDEPASEILKNITIEKAKLINECKIKKQKSLPPIMEDEKPFDLPDKWEWVRLGDVANYGNSEKAEAKDVDSNTWVLELEDVEKVTSKLLAKVRFKDREFRSSKNRFLTGDVIYGKLRPYLDKALVADENGVCSTEMIPVRGHANIFPMYLRLAMKTPYFIRYANDSTHGMSLPRMGTDKARLALIPLLSVEQQHRIVAKVDELMALCDQLEQQTETSISAHQTLVQTLLGTLTNTNERKGFNQAWARIAEHFDTLFTTEWSIDQLEQTILQLAVMGKLVPQNSNDEPVSELLKKIAAEKASLIKEGKIRKQKPLPEINDEEVSFNSPDGWAWSRMGELAQYQKGYAFKSKDYLDCGLMITKIQNLTENHIQNSVYIATERALEFTQYLLCEGDIVMTTVGSWFSSPISAVGRSFLINKLFDHSLLNQNAVRIRSWKELDPMYLFTCINSPIYKNYLVQEAQGTANQASITQESIKNFLICVPPKEEQHRIVSKVNELMALCHTLKKRINNAQITQFHLADAMAEQALN